MGKEVRGGNPDRTNRNSVYVRSEINDVLEIVDKLNGIFLFCIGFFRVFYMVNIWLVICLFLG